MKGECIKYCEENLPFKVLVSKDAVGLDNVVMHIGKASPKPGVVILDVPMDYDVVGQKFRHLVENLLDVGSLIVGSKYLGGEARIGFSLFLFTNDELPRGILGKDVRLLRWPEKRASETGEAGKITYFERMRAMGPVQWEKIGLQVNVRPSIDGAPVVKSKRHGQDLVADLHASLGDAALMLETAQNERDHYKQKLKDMLGASPSPLPPKRAREDDDQAVMAPGADDDQEEMAPAAAGSEA